MAKTKRNDILDYINLEILRRLSKDARIAFSDLAKDLKISNSLVHQRVRKLLDSNIIEGFSIKLSPVEMGYETIAFTGIVAKEAHYTYSIAEKLKDIPEVVECHFVTGQYALFIKIITDSNEGLRKILFDKIHIIEGVGSTDSYISFVSVFEKNLPIK